MSFAYRSASLFSVLFFALSHAHAAGTLAATGAGHAPMRILDHHVEVLIDNGYARTQVTQVFENPSTETVEAIYTLPLPEGAALAEMEIAAGDRTLRGEVVLRDEAQMIYDEQVAAGGQAALAVKEGYQRFEFRIAAIAAGEQATLTFAYYQALEIDAGVGRYLYPLEEGGTDEAADEFWTRNAQVDGVFSAHIALRSAWPVEDVRVPEFENVAVVQQDAPGRVSIEIQADRDLDRDLILYYRLPDDLPGRVELIPYRDSAEEPGTFMMVLTPGMDLEALTSGRDLVYALDVSGSMEGKLGTLKEAVTESIRTLSPGDRFRIVKFSDTASALTEGWVSVGSEDEIAEQLSAIEALQIEGGTNLYDGLSLALENIDSDRATGVMLVTDAVANEGLVDGPSFSRLLAERDVRVYGFLIGNSGNWPLMQLLTETSGGFYAQVSNSDDIQGQLLLARNKLTHTALHDFTLSFDGGGIVEVTHTQAKVHRGEQVVVFGRYQDPGPVTLDVSAKISGKVQHYTGSFHLPESDASNPELERLWAFAQVRWLEYQARMELIDASNAVQKIAALGLQYQLVTDETSMVLLSDEDFERLGIDPNNRERSAREDEARKLRTQGEPVDYSVPVDSGFSGESASGGSYGGYDDGSGGGAVGAIDVGVLGLLGLFALRAGRRRRGLRA